MSATVVVTRAAHQAEELIGLLRQGGLNVLHFPVIHIEYRPMDISLSEFDWIVFTSANAARSVLCHTKALPAEIRIATLGQSTARVVRKLGRDVDWVSPTATGDALVKALVPEVRGQLVLVPMSDRADTSRWDYLRDADIKLQLVTTYSTKCETGHSVEQKQALKSADMVLFASPSAFDCFARVVGLDLLMRLQLAVIGPTTRTAIERSKLTVTVESPEPTTAAFAEAVISFLEMGRKRALTSADER